MGYHLGVDLGTTYTCAAVERGGRVDIVTLGDRAAAVPSVLFLRDDGTFLVGEAAERRALTDPARVAREFKRRLGDTAPVLVGGSPYGAEVLTARLLAWVVAQVAEREGGPPSSIAITHPANWGPFKLDLLRQAVEHAGVGPVTFLSEPEAAARSWASQERVEVGSTVAVYDLGGGTFDAAVLAKTATGFDLLGAPQGIERLGGIDVDAAVLAHVDQAVDGRVSGADVGVPAILAEVARLHREIVEAKKALSSDSDVTIAVGLPALNHTVRLTRGELESLIRPVLTETITALRRALDVAGVLPAGLGAVLLVGGSSRIPLVAQLVSAELGRPVALDTHPKHAVAMGAALAAAGAAAGPAAAAPVVPLDPAPVPPTAPVVAVPPVVATPAPPPSPVAAPPTATVPVVPPGPPPVAPVTPVPAATGGSNGARWAVLVVLVVAIAAAAAVLVLRQGGDDVADGVTLDTATTETTGTTAPAPTTTAPATTASTAGATTTASTAPTTTEPVEPDAPAFSATGRPISGASRSDGALLVGDAVFGSAPDGLPLSFGLDGSGETVFVGVEGFAGLDTVLRILDEDGNIVAANDDQVDADGNAISRDPLIELVIPIGQTFVAEVEPFAGAPGDFVLFMDPVGGGE